MRAIVPITYDKIVNLDYSILLETYFDTLSKKFILKLEYEDFNNTDNNESEISLEFNDFKMKDEPLHIKIVKNAVDSIVRSTIFNFCKKSTVWEAYNNAKLMVPVLRYELNDLNKEFENDTIFDDKKDIFEEVFYKYELDENNGFFEYNCFINKEADVLIGVARHIDFKGNTSLIESRFSIQNIIKLLFEAKIEISEIKDLIEEFYTKKILNKEMYNSDKESLSKYYFCRADVSKQIIFNTITNYIKRKKKNN